uniref:Suppression of tumorigenicity 14a n=1 Tax=Cyprinus carpio TaxID=7962 RepID=A0A8C2B7G7_CYPCA
MWDTAVTFLPASDNKKLEKKRGPGKVGIVVGLVILAAVLALIIGLLVWHFHFRKDLKLQKIYTGTLRITNQAFVDAYENPDSTEFKQLASQVMDQLKSMYSESPELSKYYVGSRVQAFSEGSVIAYYESEFAVPVGQDKAVDRAVSSLDETYSTKVRRVQQGPLVFDHVVSSGNTFGWIISLKHINLLFSVCPASMKFAEHARSSAEEIIKSPGFPDQPYTPNTFVQWELRGDPGHMLKLTFDTFNLEENCANDFVRVYDSLVAMDKHLMADTLCGQLPANTMVTVNSNQVSVVFKSDSSQVDRGFSATYEVFDPSDPCPDQFQCNNKRCINPSLRCDGWNDCGDSTDERNCKCDASMIQCRNGICKPMFWRCDGVNDCGDDTDELNCGCKVGEFKCSNDQCVSEKLKCDGNRDCKDGSDEDGCTRDICKVSTFACNNGKCITKQNPMCDGQDDCGDNSDESSCDCGKKAYTKSRIVGGQEADMGEFPWQVSLHIKNTAHVCGASIISDRWLVTAAHCVQDDAKVKYGQPGTWEAYLGLHRQIEKQQATKRFLKQIIPHKNYNSYTYDNDIALMELDSPVTFNETIRPICLPSATDVFPAGETVTITGWGATREGAPVLQKANVRIINSTVCDELMNGQITSRMTCAGVLTGGVDACQGDSGGPMSYFSNDRMFLAGVVSWGDGCARRNKPGIYTNVPKFRAWIKEKTGV